MSFDFSDHNEGFVQDKQGNFITMAEKEANWRKKEPEEKANIIVKPEMPQTRE